MAVDYSKFKANLNSKEVEDLEKKYKANQNNGSFAELPSGTYAVELEKMEVGTSSWGQDQINITFKIIDGDHKGQRIFYNGSFDTHFAHGYDQTARLISGMTGGDVTEFDVLHFITKDPSEVKTYILDLYQMIAEQRLSYDLDYEVRTSTKINPNNNKPYVNKFFTITEVYETD